MPRKQREQTAAATRRAATAEILERSDGVMLRKQLLLLAAIAFAVAATAAWCEPSGKNWQMCDDGVVRQIGIDGAYAAEHPEQVGLQERVVYESNRTSVLDCRVTKLENRPEGRYIISGENSQVRSPVQVTINMSERAETVTPKPAAPPSSDGPKEKSETEKKVGGMSPLGWFVTIVVVIVGGVLLLTWAIPAITESQRRRKIENNNELNTERAQQQAEAERLRNLEAERAAAAKIDLLGRIREGRPDDFPEEEYSGSVPGVGTIRGRRTSEDTFRTRAAAGGGTGAIVSAQAMTAAGLSLQRPTTAMPISSTPVAARVIPYSDAKRDRLAEAINSLPVLGDAVVDGILSDLIRAGQISVT